MVATTSTVSVACEDEEQLLVQRLAHVRAQRTQVATPTAVPVATAVASSSVAIEEVLAGAPVEALADASMVAGGGIKLAKERLSKEPAPACPHGKSSASAKAQPLVRNEALKEKR